MSRSPLSKSILSKLAELREILRAMGKVLVAYSGGVDSTLLLKVASDALGKETLAVIAASETYPEAEVKGAGALARRLGVRYKVIHTHEIENPDFVKNPPLRCYYCKHELFSRLKDIAKKEGIAYVLDGQNVDDLGDFRPGAKAGKKLGIRSPLKEAGLTKDEIRKLSRHFGLPTWNKPSLACLASRFPYHTRIDKKSLKQVGKAEDFLRELGFGQIRVRHHGRIARLEIRPEEFAKAVRPEIRGKIVGYMKKIGYLYVTLDLAGYRTGSLNEALRLKYEDRQNK